MADRTVVVRLIADTGNYEHAMARSSRATDGLRKSGGQSIVTLSKLGKLAGGFLAGSVAVAGVRFDALQESSSKAFTTMLGDAAKAKSTMADLYAFARETPFAYPQILKASQQLTAFGLEGDKLLPTLRAIGDATAAVGGNSEQFSRIALAMGQIQTKGSLQAEEMRQLAEAGLPAWQILADYLGRTVPEAMKLVEDRSVDSTTAIEALTAGIEQRFGGSMKNLEGTWTKSVDSFTSSARRLGGSAIQPLMKSAQDGMDAVTRLMNQAGPGLAGVANGVQMALSPVIGTLGAFVGLLDKLPPGSTAAAVALGAVALGSDRLNNAWSRARDVGVRFSDQMRVQRALAAASGVELGRLGAAASVASTRIAAAGRGMVAAFGGPVGLAIVGVTTALGIYASRQQKAKQAADEHKTSVDALAGSLDLATLALNTNGRAQIDNELASRKLGSTGKSVSDTVRQLGLDLGTYRTALQEGNESSAFKHTTAAIRDQAKALIEATPIWESYRQHTGQTIDEAVDKVLRGEQFFKDRALSTADHFDYNMLRASDGLKALSDVYQYVGGETDAFAEKQKQLADAIALKLPDAAAAAGVSIDQLRSIIDQWVGSGKQLGDVLLDNGITADQASVVINKLGFTAAEAGGGFSGMAGGVLDATNRLAEAARQAVETRNAIAQAAASFVSVTGAWDAVVQRKESAASGGGGGARAPKAKKVADDPAVKAAATALDAFKKQRTESTRVAREAEKDAKAFAKSEKAKADAAKKTAAELKKAADDATKKLTVAQDRKARADKDAADAAALFAAVQQQALRSGTADLEAWTAATTLAGKADTAAKAEQVAATQGLETAQATAKTATDNYAQAQQAAATAQRDAAAAQTLAAKAQKDAADVIADLARQYQKLLNDKRAAENRARASTQSMATGGAAAVGGMVRKVRVSLAEYLTELRKQVKAQEDWKTNLLKLAAKIEPGLVAELAKLGPSAAPLVAALVNGTRAQMDEFEELFPHSTQQGMADSGIELVKGGNLLAQIAATAGRDVAGKYATALANGKVTVEQAMAVLRGNVDKDTLQVSLGIKNRKDVENALDRLTKPRTMQVELQLNVTNGRNKIRGMDFQFREYAQGGWIRGGSGVRDDVPLLAMGGEFMVNAAAAAKWGRLLEQINGGGDPVAALPARPAPSPMFLPAPASGGGNHYEIHVHQQPGQSVQGLVAEIDRRAPLEGAR